MYKLLLFFPCLFLSNAYATYIEKAGFFSPSIPMEAPLADHWIVEYGPPHEIITLEDGSTWIVKPADQEKLCRWDYSDPVTIVQNRCPISNYQYLILNQMLQEMVAVCFSLESIYEKEPPHWINVIDKTYSYLILEDNSRWNINSYDRQILSNWRVDDIIIIGTNSSWSSEEYILINVTLDEYVRAEYLWK